MLRDDLTPERLGIKISEIPVADEKQLAVKHASTYACIFREHAA